ncbi:MAG: hypothetical protein RLP44_03260 [Aggregatilineales bacterium]
MQNSRQKPLEFRRDEVTYIMQRWMASESCSLVGIGSVGKSNLLRHLADSKVQESYLKISNANEFRTIIIDPNLFGPLPRLDSNEAEQFCCWAGYEILMHRLFMNFFPFTENTLLSKQDGQEFYELYKVLQDGTNPLYAYMGIRYFELGLQIILQHGIRIVFMFDEFEKMLTSLPPVFFQSLRGIRDTHKKQLGYLTFTRAPLDTLVETLKLDTLALEPFTELFVDNVYYVGPYNQADAMRMIDELMSQNNKKLTEIELEFLLWSSGRYAGLIRSIYHTIDVVKPLEKSAMGNEGVLRKLALRRSIRTECRTTWLSLTQSEKHVLRAVAGLENYNSNAETERAVAMLVQKHLLKVNKLHQTLEVQPPIFKAYIVTHDESDQAQ